jgi:pimeloyl-ACP methyl ester carboxylesterase
MNNVIHLEFHSKIDPSHRKAILFVHGIWHGAWCWHEAWLNYFYEKGYDVHTFSFRNHGESEQKGNTRWLRIADYVDDLASIHAEINKPVFLIGHSVGGLVVQKYLERDPMSIRGAVLLAPVPPHGAWRATFKTFWEHTGLFLEATLTFSLKPFIKKPALARVFFVGNDFPDAELVPYWRKLQDESYLVFLDALFLNLPKPEKIKVPILVLGAEKDYFFPPKDIHATAKAYGTEAVIYPNAPHNLFMLKGWEAVASSICNWLSID